MYDDNTRIAPFLRNSRNPPPIRIPAFFRFHLKKRFMLMFGRVAKSFSELRQRIRFA